MAILHCKLIAATLAALCIFIQISNADVLYSRCPPRGFELSLSEEDGVASMDFHCKLNQPMNGLEAGTWSREIRQTDRGRWRFREYYAQIMNGDKIYCWIYVHKHGKGETRNHILLQF